MASHPLVPPQLGHLETEQRLADSAAVDALSTKEILHLINTQDALIPTIVGRAIPEIAKLVDRLLEAINHGGRLIYVGAGTSGRLGVLDASECPPTFHVDPDQVIGLIAGGDSALRRSSEGKEDDPNGAVEQLGKIGLRSVDVVVGIAAGATTPFVWGALQFAKQRGAVTGLVCSVPLSQLKSRQDAAVVVPNEPRPRPAWTRLPAPVDYPIEVVVGPEVVTGSTRMKAGTATKLVLNMITTSTMVRLGKVWGNLMVDLKASNQKLRDRALRILCSQGRIDRSEAAEMLDRAGGQVKPALVMARRGLTFEEAQNELKRHNGRLRQILGPPR